MDKADAAAGRCARALSAVYLRGLCYYMKLLPPGKGVTAEKANRGVDKADNWEVCKGQSSCISAHHHILQTCNPDARALTSH